jgi:hypothetical protein
MNIELKDLMKVHPEDLAATQFEALKQHVIETLDLVMQQVKDEAFQDLHKGLAHSPAGDCMGDDNHYIDFGYSNECLDIAEVIDQLSALKQQMIKTETEALDATVPLKKGRTNRGASCTKLL